MPFDLLKKKLLSRLEAMGIRVLKTYEEVIFTTKSMMHSRSSFLIFTSKTCLFACHVKPIMFSKTKGGCHCHLMCFLTVILSRYQSEVIWFDSSKFGFLRYNSSEGAYCAYLIVGIAITRWYTLLSCIMLKPHEQSAISVLH